MSIQQLGSHLTERVRSREVAEAHFVAEVSNNPDEILTSMKSYDPLLTSVVVGSDAASLQLVRCRTRDEQRAFYAASRAQAHMVAVDLFTSIGGEWYGFVHGLATGTVLATGESYTAELIGLLPTTPDEDTIAGEVGLSWPLDIGKQGDAPGALAYERVATMRAHDAWLEALRSGDAGRVAGRYATGARVAMRHPLTGEITGLEGRVAVAAYYRSLFADTAVRAVDVVTRLVDRWFAFTELVVRLSLEDGGEAVAQMADVCVIGRDDTIVVHLGTTAGPAVTPAADPPS
jgi:hypothetical protein